MGVKRHRAACIQIYRFVPRELESIKCGNPNTDPRWPARRDGSWYPVAPGECGEWRAHLMDCWRGRGAVTPFQTPHPGVPGLGFDSQ